MLLANKKLKVIPINCEMFLYKVEKYCLSTPIDGPRRQHQLMRI